MNVMIKILSVFVVTALVALAYLYSTRSKSVLYRFGKSEAMSTGGVSFSLFNPFRDRGPERQAEALLARYGLRLKKTAIIGEWLAMNAGTECVMDQIAISGSRLRGEEKPG